MSFTTATIIAAIAAGLTFYLRRPRPMSDAPAPVMRRPFRVAMIFGLVGFPFLLAAWQTADNRMRKLGRVESLFPGGAERLRDEAIAEREAEEERQRNAIAATATQRAP